ncbi:MAG: tRNA (N6-threonylcarbamoyladenosine(37)-N6)-methyltransferase TrmO [Idiomarina sp.]|nr:tRNA (N6-threonylcarbamoyladenosine(37)-N6)-methyltransferase TrmO [Idiomarina sp.]
MQSESYQLEPIGYIESPYKQKFAIPRQPGLVKSAKGSIRMLSPFDHPDCFRGIEAFSHLWLNFRFHETAKQGWKALVRPPRLGGNERKGVFATRSTFRPNAMGLSVVKFLGIEQCGNALRIQVSGLDLLDGTPVLDIKPYLPYADAVPDALGGFADDAPTTGMDIEFSPEAESNLSRAADYPELRQLIIEVLSQDPRPAYQRGPVSDRTYGMHLYHFNIKWRVNQNTNQVLQISPE